MYAHVLLSLAWCRLAWMVLIVLGFTHGCGSSQVLEQYQKVPVYVIPDSLIPRDSFDLPFFPTIPPMSIPLPPFLSPDNKLIADISSGGVARERATTQLSNQYQGLIAVGQQRYHLSQEEAQDVFSDAITMLIRQIQDGTFRKESQIGTYLHRIFSNQCITWLRHKSRHKRSMQWEALAEVESSEADPLQQLLTKENLKAWECCFRRISDLCYQILWESLVEGYPAQEMIQRLNLSSTRSLASMKHRYLKKVRQQTLRPISYP